MYLFFNIVDLLRLFFTANLHISLYFLNKFLGFFLIDLSMPYYNFFVMVTLYFWAFS